MIVIVLPDIPVEDRLLAQARQGDQDAVMKIYNSYFPPIYNFIRLRVDDPTLAEDLTSEVFIKLVTALRGRSAPRHSLRGWLFQVARNVLRDHFGQMRRLSTQALDEWLPDSPDSDPELHFMRTLSSDLIRRALRSLSPDQQEVLILRFGQMLSLQETADIMGKQVGAIKSIQFRAVGALRQILSQMQVERNG